MDLAGPARLVPGDGELDAVVIRNGVEIPTTSLVTEGPEICCTEPSNGFLYGGIHEFDVQPGDVYGFRLRGSNGDLNNFLRGTFTLSTKPYIDATIGTRQPAVDRRHGDLDGDVARHDGRLPRGAGRGAVVQVPCRARPAGHRQPTSPADYDLALYGDIGSAFDQLAERRRPRPSSPPPRPRARPGAETQTRSTTPASPRSRRRSTKPPVTTQFAPRIYAPRIYAPRIYAPRIYAPRIYAPRIYAPRIYAPDSFVPDLESNTFFRDAFSAAQNQTLLAMSANTDLAPETVSASTGNTDGYFYVRVQGATDEAFDAGTPFSLRLNRHRRRELPRALDLRHDADDRHLAATRRAVIVTDTQQADDGRRLDGPAGLSRQARLAGDPHRGSRGRRPHLGRACEALQDQVATHPTCPYATNLVAREIQSIVDRYRGDATKYVVIAGGDEVIPFFRYPDTSGLGQESQFEPPVQPEHACRRQPGQRPGPRPGRLRLRHRGDDQRPHDAGAGPRGRTPGEDAGRDHGHRRPLPRVSQNGTLPAPTSSLVTGYDFLADAADAVGTTSSRPLSPGDRPQRPS